MTGQANPNREHTLITRHCLLFGLGWTLVCILAVSWNITAAREKTLDLAQKEARTILDKTEALVLWATDLEYIYVPATEKNPPSDALDHVPERDLITPSGRLLTMLDPAALSHQVINRHTSLNSAKGHITSLHTQNSSNTPDTWEAHALRDFADGKKETLEVVFIGDSEFLRIIKPLYTVAGCLACHAKQGYAIGDVIGGISVHIPLTPYREMEKKTLDTVYYTLLFFCSSGLLVIAFTFYRDNKRLQDRLVANRQLQEQSAKIELFAYSVIHDLKNPAVAMLGLAKLLRKKHQENLNDKGRLYCEQIEKAAEQTNALVDLINIYITAKEHPLVVEPLDLLDICHLLRDEYGEKLRERTITWQEPTKSARIFADKMALIRILRNIIDNALKYGGDRLGTIALSHEESSEYQTICVANDGQPISPEDCRTIFQKFKRNCKDQRVEGAGLGLAIVKELVGIHLGQVWAQSDGKRGVAFSFTIAKTLQDKTIARPRSFRLRKAEKKPPP